MDAYVLLQLESDTVKAEILGVYSTEDLATEAASQYPDGTTEICCYEVDDDVPVQAVDGRSLSVADAVETGRCGDCGKVIPRDELAGVDDALVCEACYSNRVWR